MFLVRATSSCGAVDSKLHLETACPHSRQTIAFKLHSNWASNLGQQITHSHTEMCGRSLGCAVTHAIGCAVTDAAGGVLEAAAR